MKRRERNIIIETAYTLTHQCLACCKLYYQALTSGNDTQKTAYFKDRYNTTLSNWQEYQNKFNQVKFSFFSPLYHKKLWLFVKERSKQIDEYSKLINTETNNVY